MRTNRTRQLLKGNFANPPKSPIELTVAAVEFFFPRFKGRLVFAREALYGIRWIYTPNHHTPSMMQRLTGYHIHLCRSQLKRSLAEFHFISSHLRLARASLQCAMDLRQRLDDHFENAAPKAGRSKHRRLLRCQFKSDKG